MMSLIIPLILLIIIVDIIFIITMIKKSNSKENNTTNIISFLFPIIGLIIYAVNIGKNDELAKSGIKYALYGMIVPIVSFIVTIIIGMIIYNAHSTTTTSVSPQ